MLVTLYFIFTYFVALGFAYSKAKNEDGWDMQLLLTIIVFPIIMPLIVMMEMHSYLNKKSTF